MQSLDRMRSLTKFLSRPFSGSLHWILYWILPATAFATLWPSSHERIKRAGYLAYSNMLSQQNQSLQMAREIIAAELTVLEKAALDQRIPDETRICIELQFLWGFFGEFSKVTSGVPSVDRIKADLTYYLVVVYAYNPEDALEEVNAIEELYEASEPIFSILSRSGSEVFHDKVSGRLTVIISALLKAGLGDSGLGERNP
jgi:hypothetical protein